VEKRHENPYRILKFSVVLYKKVIFSILCIERWRITDVRPSHSHLVLLLMIPFTFTWPLSLPPPIEPANSDDGNLFSNLTVAPGSFRDRWVEGATDGSLGNEGTRLVSGSWMSSSTRPRSISELKKNLLTLVDRDKDKVHDKLTRILQDMEGN